MPPYPPAKHALLGMTKSLCLKFSADKILVNALAPDYARRRR